MILSDTTPATSKDSGALQVDGGVGVNGNIYCATLFADTTEVEGALVIDVDNSKALLVRKDGDIGDVLAVDTNTATMTVSNPFFGITEQCTFIVENDLANGLSLITNSSNFSVRPNDSFIETTHDLYLGAAGRFDDIHMTTGGETIVKNDLQVKTVGERLTTLAMGPTSTTITVSQLLNNVVWVDFNAGQTITFPQDADFDTSGLPDPFYFSRTWKNLSNNNVDLARGSTDESFVHSAVKDQAGFTFNANTLIQLSVHYNTAESSPRKVVYFIHQTA
jgi:hypothetical protein